VSDTNLLSHPESIPIGPCSLCLMNEITDHLVVIGKVDNIMLDRLDPQNVFVTEVLNGQTVNSAGQPTFCGFQVKGKLKEILDPNTAHLAMKNCGTPTQAEACGLETAIEDYTAYPGRCIKLKHNVGFYSTASLPGPDAVAGVAGGNGGTIATDGYYFVVTCMYGTTESDYTESAIVNVVSPEVITLSITPPTGLNPTAYRIYFYNDAETRVDATLVLQITSWSAIGDIVVVFTALPHTGDLYPGDATGSFTVEDSDGNLLDVTDDYTVDTTCGVVCFPATGEVEEGELLTITYAYRRNPYVSMSIGPSNTLPPYVHPVLIQLKNDDRADIRPRGVEIHLWKVLASSGWSWDLSSLTFEAGFDFTWEVLMSEKTLNHGQITLFSRHYANYDLSNWAALTEWSNGPGCEDESA